MNSRDGARESLRIAAGKSARIHVFLPARIIPEPVGTRALAADAVNFAAVGYNFAFASDSREFCRVPRQHVRAGGGVEPENDTVPKGAGQCWGSFCAD
jgi:hypothetical protein